MKRKFVTALFLVFFICITVYADRGSFPIINIGAKIFEPKQRAMIAWNGKEEILLLSTDLRASEATKVLEILPLPSEPVVKKGDVEVFKKAAKLINKKIGSGFDVGAYSAKASGDGFKSLPAGEVKFHEIIGAHDISVAHVIDSSGFVEWVEKYLKSIGVENPFIPEPMKEVIGEYLEEGFKWLVFDVVSLDEELKTNDAIQYRFATDTLFYPLKISRTAVGDTTVILLVLTQELLADFSGIPKKTVQLVHDPILVSSKEIRSLSEEMDDLLGHQDYMKLRIWEIKGELSSFANDLKAK